MSLQTKLIVMGLLFVVVTATTLSATYAMLMVRNTRRESLQRIQIALDIMADDVNNQMTSYTQRLEGFLQENTSVSWAARQYRKDRLSSAEYLHYLVKAADDLKNFGAAISTTTLGLYAPDNRLLAIYQQQETREIAGVLVLSHSGQHSLLPLDDPAHPLQAILIGEQPIPDISIPVSINPRYEGELPQVTTSTWFFRGAQLGLRISAPIADQKRIVGVLMAELVFTTPQLKRYAKLSHTEMNLFTRTRFSVGTLPYQKPLDRADLKRLAACEELTHNAQTATLVSLSIDERFYYQAQCALRTPDGEVGAMTISLSQALERDAIRQMLVTVLLVASGVSLGVFLLIVIISRQSLKLLQHVIHTLARIANGDIPEKIARPDSGEMEEIRQNVNALIDAMNQIAAVAGKIAAGDVNITVTTRSAHDPVMQALQRMVASLREVARVAHEIAEGNLTVDVIARSAEDSLMQALQPMVLSLREVARVTGAIADGNLAVEVLPRSAQDHLMTALQAMVARLQEIVSSVKSAADGMATSGAEVSAGAEMVAQGAAHQAATTEELSATMHEMATNNRQNAANAKKTEAIAIEAAEYAVESANVVMHTMLAMQDIGNKIQKVELIANQTRMLSLNATIEAAKVHEHGKAFGVVAAEVRQLANVTRTAAEEIKAVVTAIIEVSQQATEMLATLVPNIQQTAELVQEINVASHEQHLGAEQMNLAIQHLDQVTQQNAMTSEELAATAEELAAQAQQLQHAIAFFAINAPNSSNAHA